MKARQNPVIPPHLQQSARILRLVRSLMAPDGSIDRLVDAVAVHRGSPIDLTPAHMGPGPLRGFQVVGPDRDHIVYSATATGIQRDLIICHELAHLLLGHVGEFDHERRPRDLTRLVTRHTYDASAEADARRLARAFVWLSRARQRPARRAGSRPSALTAAGHHATVGPGLTSRDTAQHTDH